MPKIPLHWFAHRYEHMPEAEEFKNEDREFPNGKALIVFKSVETSADCWEWVLTEIKSK